MTRRCGSRRPFGEQSADDTSPNAISEIVRSEQVGENCVVIPGVNRDLGTTVGAGDAAHRLQCAIPVERRQLDRDDTRLIGQLAPESTLR